MARHHASGYLQNQILAGATHEYLDSRQVSTLVGWRSLQRTSPLGYLQVSIQTGLDTISPLVKSNFAFGMLFNKQHTQMIYP